MFGTLKANLTRVDIPLDEIEFGLAPHYHIDRRRCTPSQERGVPLLVIDCRQSDESEANRICPPHVLLGVCGDAGERGRMVLPA
jgi:hypothetical protein